MKLTKQERATLRFAVHAATQWDESLLQCYPTRPVDAETRAFTRTVKARMRRVKALGRKFREVSK